MKHRVTLTIDLDTLAKNYQAICDVASPCAVMPILKANAYGLGVRPIAEALKRSGAKRLAVAEPFEALELRDLGLPVQILSGILPEEITPMVEADVILPLVDEAVARLISAEAVKQGKVAKVHVKLDTGMGRAGILWHEAAEVLRRVKDLPHLEIEGIFTHFPLAYEERSDFTDVQLQRFMDVLTAAQAMGLRFTYIHAANSDAINNAPRACQFPFNLVRTGINLHGAFDAAGSLRVPLTPVLTLQTRLTQIRTLPAQTPIGYGHTFTTQRPQHVGTVCAGYADGLPLALSNCGEVLLRGKRIPILGRISMDYLTVDLDAVPEATVGDVITLLGTDGDETIQVQDWASAKQTHAYDIVCSIGSRVFRQYR